MMPLLKPVTDVFDFAYRQVDRVAPPEFRQNTWNKTRAFYAEQPWRFTFLLAQVLFAGMPVLCFLAFSLSVFFAFATGILFLSLFSAGLAFCILVPILVVTFCMALFTWGSIAAVVGLSRLTYAAVNSAFTIAERDFHPRYQVDYPILPGPNPAPVVNPGGPGGPVGPVPHKAKRAAATKKDDKPSDSEKEPLPHSDAGSGVDAPER